MSDKNAERGRGFALVELVVVCLLVAVAAVMFFGMVGKQRRSSQQTESVSNLRQIGAMTGAYVGDSGDLLPGYSWVGGVRYGNYVASNDVSAWSNQLLDILRRRFDPSVPFGFSTIAPVFYGHVPLADHAGLRLPNAVFANPGDPFANELLRQPGNLNLYPTLVNIPPIVVRGSYRTATALYSGRWTIDGGLLQHAGESHSSYLYNPGSGSRFRLRQQLLSAFAFPSQKAQMFDGFDWFSRSAPLHFGFGAARCGVLMLDGAASTRDLSTANDGAYTSSSNTFTYLRANLTYQATAGSPLSPPGPAGAPAEGSARLEFTYRQQLGRDFGPQAP